MERRLSVTNLSSEKLFSELKLEKLFSELKLVTDNLLSMKQLRLKRCTKKEMSRRLESAVEVSTHKTTVVSFPYRAVVSLPY